MVRCLQPRGFVAQAQAAVREYLGPTCVSNEQLVDFEAIFAVTEATMPIVLISSTDHTLPFLQQFADSRGISVMHMAIGRGQGAATDRLIRSAVGEFWDSLGVRTPSPPPSPSYFLTCILLRSLICSRIF